MAVPPAEKPASPTPTSMRGMSTPTKLLARPVINVNALQIKAIRVMAFLRLQRSTRKATGKEKSAMLRVNTVSSSPTSESLSPSSTFIGWTTTVSTVLST